MFVHGGHHAAIKYILDDTPLSSSDRMRSACLMTEEPELEISGNMASFYFLCLIVSEMFYVDMLLVTVECD